MKKLSNDEYLKFFSRNFYKKILKESLVSYKRNITKSEAKSLIYSAYEKLIDYDYYVSNPAEYIYLLKNEFVARIIPIFSIEDESIYFFLCKQIENDIACNRIPGTFGGWALGNAIREQEEDEIQYVINSYNPWLWTKYWKEFQHYIYSNIEKYDYKYALKMDIANFYDSINIDILSNKLYRICDKTKFEYVDLIIYILKFWNRKFNKYGENNVGIPQNEFGDQSRLLANIYLNEYDEIMYETCLKNNAMYSRYADDQIILFNDENDIYKIMLVANEELRKIGLNLNAGKTKKYSKDQLINHFLFVPLELLDAEQYDEAVAVFFDIVKICGGIEKVRSDTFFRRSLSIGLNKFSNDSRKKILDNVLTKKFIISSNVDYLYKIYNNLSNDEKKQFIHDIENYFKLITFNGFHYVVINFLKKINLTKEYEEYISKVDDNLC